MKKKSRLYLYLITAIISSLSTNILWAANPHSVNETFATLNAQGSSIFWSIHPSVKYASITLKLTSDGETWETTSNGEPSVDSLADGGYKYELVVTPLLSPAVKAELKAARRAAKGQEAKEKVKELKNLGKIPQHRQVQSGYFTIAYGQIVSPDDAVEE